MTDKALHGASLEATVGQFTTGRSRPAAAARAVSRTLPPPAPTITRALACRAACWTRSISASEHSPPKGWTAWAIPASRKVRSQVWDRSWMAERPATSSAGPRRPRPVISRPSAAVAFFPWVYRLGEQKTDNIGWASDREIEIPQVSAVQPAGSPLPVDSIEDSNV